MKEEEDLYFTRPLSFFHSSHFLLLLFSVLPRFTAYIELSSENVITHSVVTNSPFIHGFRDHDMTSNIFLLIFGLAGFVVSFFFKGLISAMLSDFFALLKLSLDIKHIILGSHVFLHQNSVDIVHLLLVLNVDMEKAEVSHFLSLGNMLY